MQNCPLFLLSRPLDWHNFKFINSECLNFTKSDFKRIAQWQLSLDLRCWFARVRAIWSNSTSISHAANWTENLPVGLSVKFISASINEWINHWRCPCKNRSNYVNNWRLELHDIDKHQWKKAEEEAEKYDEHKSCDSRVFAPLKSRIPSRSCMCLQFFPALPDLPVYAEVGNYDHEAREKEADDEEKFLRTCAVLLEDRAGEGLRVVAQSAPYTGEWRYQ